MPGRQDYEERKQARIDRLYNAADKAQNASDAAWERSNDLSRRFEGGQPILVGHHSEQGARAIQKKIHTAMARSVEYSEKASSLRQKAEAAEKNTAISSDDPDCIEKLQAKLDALVARRDRYKTINAFYRKNKTCKGCEGVDDTLAAKLDENAKSVLNQYKPIPDYELTNLGARIRDIKKRLETLKLIDEMPEETISFDGFCEIESNPETNRVVIRFFVQIGDDLKRELDMYGFRWAYSLKQWQKLRNPHNWAQTKRIAERAFHKYKENLN